MELKEINSNKETLKRNLLDLIELQHILKKTQVFFQEVSSSPSCLISHYDSLQLGGRLRHRTCVQVGTAG